jgi:hypothetical protein
MRRALIAAALGLAVLTPARAQPPTPLTQDPLGPLVDVTDDYAWYQPATAFCVKPEVFEFTGDTGGTATGADSACAFSGFAPGDTGLYKVEIESPPGGLCGGCRRLFLDYSQIPEGNAPPLYYARGHAYFRLDSFNPSYTVDPKRHSPNIKNFSNDKLFVPDDSDQEPFVHGFDLHSMAYTGDTANFAHAAVQGPYYVGPWYVNQFGIRINGAYLDVNVITELDPLPNPALNEIGYGAAFNSGEATCLDNVLFDGDFRDGNYFYGGCIDRFGGSAEGVNPY